MGNRLSMTDPDGATAYNYDNLYRLTGVTYPDGETVSYAYDPMGNRTSLISTVHGTTTYTYDALAIGCSQPEPPHSPGTTTAA